MRRIALAATLTVLAAACGGDGAATTSTAAPVTTQPTTSTASSTTTTAAPSGPTDCAEIWPTEMVQDVAGPGMEFLAANDDASACTYLGDSGGIALAWRVSTFDEYQQGRTGAEATAPTVDREVCDAAYSTELGGVSLIMEAYSEADGRTYTATISGADPDDALAWATELLGAVC